MRLDDWTTVTRARTLEQPTCDAEVVSAEALRLLDAYAPARPVRLLGVRVAGLNAATDSLPAEGPSAAPGVPAEAQAGQLELPV